MSYFDNGHDAILQNSRSSAFPLADTNALLRLVYLWMTVGLVVTAGVAAFIASDIDRVMSISRGWIVIIVLQLGLVLALSWGIRRFSPTVASIMFVVYSAAVGLTVGVAVFVAMYSTAKGIGAPPDIMPVAKAFFSTAGLFGAMTVVGFTTKVDLSKFSTFFMMALIGLVIAMLINMFLRSDMFSLVISAFGVLLFTALTAWDTQKIKNLAAQPEYQQYSDDMKRLSILGALTLYLDFINLFLFLLRLFASGNRR
jgi:FtsH-binding integral membrane protein